MLTRTLILGICGVVSLAAATDTRLPDAAQQGDRSAVASLLQQKADVNAAQGDGMTALHWAAYKDDVPMAKMLLAAGANVKAQTRLAAVTPLFRAAKNGSAGMVEALADAGAPVNVPDGEGTTPLMLAAAAGKIDAIKVLIDHGADVNAKESAHGQTALMFAAALDRDQAVTMLMQHGADAKIATKVVDPGCGSLFNRVNCDELDENGNPLPMPRDTAAKKGASGDKAPVVQTKANQKSANGKPRRRRGAPVMGGMTPLLFAARDGQMNAARALVQAGANVNDPGAGEKMTPIVLAIGNGHYDLAKYFLDHGADPNAASPYSGLTALYATIDMQWAPYAWLPQPVTEQEKTSYLELMTALLDRGANPNARLKQRVWFRALAGDHGWVDQAGATAFWRAAQSDDMAAMKLLVDHGADPNIPTEAGDTPLMVAAGMGWAPNFSRNAPDSWIPAVKFCLEHGADVNATDAKGYTALHGTAFTGNNDLINFLVAHGGDVHVVSKDKNTVADMANGPIPHSILHPDTVALLEKLGSGNSHNCRADTCLIATDNSDMPKYVSPDVPQAPPPSADNEKKPPK